MYISSLLLALISTFARSFGAPVIEQPLDNATPVPPPVAPGLNETIPTEDVWKIKLGELCQLSRFPLPASEPEKFVECLKPNDDSNEWPWEDKGVWVMKQCIAGAEFYPLTRTCKSKRYIRRQQSLCEVNPGYSWCPSAQPVQSQFYIQPQQTQLSCQCPPSVQTCVCPQPAVIQPQLIPTVNIQTVCQQQPQIAMCQCQQQPCPTYSPPMPCALVAGTGIGNAQVGGVCSWMLSPLAADPGNPKCFLQCHPAPGNAYCGRWVRMPCAIGTIFDVTLQVCVHDPFNPPGPVIPQPQCNCGCQTGTMISSCNSNYQCPGSSICQTTQVATGCQQPCNVCCYSGGFGGK